MLKGERILPTCNKDELCTIEGPFLHHRNSVAKVNCYDCDFGLRMSSNSINRATDNRCIPVKFVVTTVDTNPTTIVPAGLDLDWLTQNVGFVLKGRIDLPQQD